MSSSTAGIRGFDAELTEEPTRRSLADILALMLTAPDDERMLGAFDLAWKIADHLDKAGVVELVLDPSDWQEIKAHAIRIADEMREDAA